MARPPVPAAVVRALPAAVGQQGLLTQLLPGSGRVILQAPQQLGIRRFLHRLKHLGLGVGRLGGGLQLSQVGIELAEHAFLEGFELDTRAAGVGALGQCRWLPQHHPVRGNLGAEHVADLVLPPHGIERIHQGNCLSAAVKAAACLAVQPGASTARSMSERSRCVPWARRAKEPQPLHARVRSHRLEFQPEHPAQCRAPKQLAHSSARAFRSASNCCSRLSPPTAQRLPPAQPPLRHRYAPRGCASCASRPT